MYIKNSCIIIVYKTEIPLSCKFWAFTEYSIYIYINVEEDANYMVS